MDYYALGVLEKHFSNLTLYSKPLSFTPGFKKIFIWGLKYQKDTFSGLGLKHFFDKAYDSDDHATLNAENEARYNLLALVYEQEFIPHFFADETCRTGINPGAAASTPVSPPITGVVHELPIPQVSAFHGPGICCPVALCLRRKRALRAAGGQAE